VDLGDIADSDFSNSIDLDSYGHPHISYARSGSLIHATGASPTAVPGGEGGSPLERVTRAAPVLYAPQPNPCRASSILSFRLPRAAAVDLALYDVVGRRVHSLLDRVALSAGRHEHEIEGRSLVPGVYVAWLTAAGESSSRKLVVLP
jgi:hypothetical protein